MDNSYLFRDVFYSTHDYIIGYSNINNFPEEIVINLMIFASIVFIIITIWIVYNKLMFGGKDRRKASKPWSKEEIINLYGINDTIYEKFKNGRVIHVNFDEDNKISDVKEIL